jgi:hypothetical protein
MHPPHTVEVTTKNTGALAMGISSLVVGIMSLLIGWVPVIGLIAIPGALLALVLALVGIVLAAMKGGKGMTLPLLGFLFGCGALLVPIVSTGVTAAAMDEAMKEEKAKQQQQKRYAPR